MSSGDATGVLRRLLWLSGATLALAGFASYLLEWGWRLPLAALSVSLDVGSLTIWMHARTTTGLSALRWSWVHAAWHGGFLAVSVGVLGFAFDPVRALFADWESVKALQQHVALFRNLFPSIELHVPRLPYYVFSLVAVVLWAALYYARIRSAERTLTRPDDEKAALRELPHPIRWFVIRLFGRKDARSARGAISSRERALIKRHALAALVALDMWYLAPILKQTVLGIDGADGGAIRMGDVLRFVATVGVFVFLFTLIFAALASWLRGSVPVRAMRLRASLIYLEPLLTGFFAGALIAKTFGCNFQAPFVPVPGIVSGACLVMLLCTLVAATSGARFVVPWGSIAMGSCACAGGDSPREEPPTAVAPPVTPQQRPPGPIPGFRILREHLSVTTIALVSYHFAVGKAALGSRLAVVGLLAALACLSWQAIGAFQHLKRKHPHWGVESLTLVLIALILAIPLAIIGAAEVAYTLDPSLVLPGGGHAVQGP